MGFDHPFEAVQVCNYLPENQTATELKPHVQLQSRALSSHSNHSNIDIN